jgi:hypothetical protein
MLVMTTRDDELTAISGWTDDEIAQDNVRAASALYAAATLEQLALIELVERLNELNQDKMLNIGAGEASNLLHEFWDKGYKRMPAKRRVAIFTQVFGSPPGDDANDAFPGLFDALLSALADGLGAAAAAATDLSENLAEHIDEAATKAAIELRATYAELAVALSDLELRTVYSLAEDWWQVAERAGAEMGGGPDVQRARTLATSGSMILRHLPALSAGEAPDDELAAAAKDWQEANASPA